MVGPVAAALVVGAALGFAGGYALITRNRPEAAPAPRAEEMASSTVPAQRAGAPNAGGREATEVSVDTPQPVAAPREKTAPDRQPPTAAPPIWLTRKHPEILPVDEKGLTKHEGTRRAACLNSEKYWNHSKTIVEQMAKALGKHPHLIAWQIDNSLGGNFTEASFNEDTRRDWHGWLEAKYETVERLNQLMGLRHWGQVVSSFKEVPMPMVAPTHLLAPSMPARSRKAAIEGLYREFFRQMDASCTMHITVLHNDALPEAQALFEQVQREYAPQEMFISIVSPVLGVHTGPRAIALCGYSEK